MNMEQGQKLNWRQKKKLRDALRTECQRCLLCLRKATVSESSKELKDSSRVIFLLKKLLGISSAELLEYLTVSGGKSPNKWFLTCMECHSIIEQAQNINDQIKHLECCLAKMKKQCMEKIVSSCKIPKKETKLTCYSCRRESCRCQPDFMITNKIRNSVLTSCWSLKRDHNCITGSCETKLRGKLKLDVCKTVSTKQRKRSNEGFPLTVNQVPIVKIESNNEDSWSHKDSCFDNDNDGPDEIDSDWLSLPEETGEWSEEEQESTFKSKAELRIMIPHKPSQGNFVKKIKRHVHLEGKFTCPLCPRTPIQETMNIYQFVQHLIFHQENPFFCNQCTIFLPDDKINLEHHWKTVHSTRESSTRSLDENYNMIRLDLQPSSVKLYNCSECKEQFETRAERDNHTRDQHDSITANTTKCTESECGEYFANLLELKIHHALMHPRMAKISCPVCTDVFENETLLTAHIQEHHSTVYVHGVKLCVYCGYPFITTRSKDGLIRPFLRSFHYKTYHPEMVRASYKCTVCNHTCSDLSSHQLHINGVHGMELSVDCWNSTENGDRDIDKVRMTPGHFLTSRRIRCLLCPLGEQATFKHESHMELHWKQSHCLEVTVEGEPKPSKVSCTASAEENKEVTKTETKRKLVREQVPIQLPKKKYNGGPEYQYNCPSCPYLEAMTLDHYIVHILFHWRHPNRCMAPGCNLYLSNVPLLINRHWSVYHSAQISTTEEKITLVNYSPGEIWNCSSCNCTFHTWSDRDAHEKDIHQKEIVPAHSEKCTVCSLQFRNMDEVRLHKAVEHPEASELCCPYCDVSFGVIAKDGQKFRHPRKLLDHLQALPSSDDACIKRLRAKQFIPEFCTLCGEVFPRPKFAQEHLIKKHQKCLNRIYSCIICHAEMSPREIKRHTYLVHSSKPMCELCGLATWPKNMKHHMFSAHGINSTDIKPFVCPVNGCGFKTIDSQNVIRHKRVHEDRRNYSCQYCGKDFKERNALKRHELIHTNAKSKPFVCPFPSCGRSFAVQNYLYVHIRCVHHRNWRHNKRTKRKKDGKISKT